MSEPFPDDGAVDLVPPDAAQVAALARGVLTAIAPAGGPTDLQCRLLGSLCVAMTGHDAPVHDVEPLDPRGLARELALRNLEFRTRIVQLMFLGELVLPEPDEVVRRRVGEYARALGVPETFLLAGRASASASLGFALIDFARNGYSAGWSPEQYPLHTTAALATAWQQSSDDPALADRWAALEGCPSGSLGRSVHAFYRNRGFVYPGRPGSAPPLLAQHDWVHVLADYGAAIDNEVEVFGFIGRASPNPQGFALLAMVIGLFETGAVDKAAGLFDADANHLSAPGMTERLADAMRRGANCGHDLMAIDCFAHADRPIEDVRARLGIGPKSEVAVVAGSAGPWEPGGITEFQLQAGRAGAEREGRRYEPFSRP